MCQRTRLRNLDRRVHLVLDATRYRKVTGEARRRRVTVALVTHEAIDRLPIGVDQRRAAIAEVLAAEAMPVPADPGEIRHELDAARDRAT